MCSTNEDVQYESGTSPVQVESAVEARYSRPQFGTGVPLKIVLNE